VKKTDKHAAPSVDDAIDKATMNKQLAPEPLTDGEHMLVYCMCSWLRVFTPMFSRLTVSSQQIVNALPFQQ